MNHMELAQQLHLKEADDSIRSNDVLLFNHAISHACSDPGTFVKIRGKNKGYLIRKDNNVFHVWKQGENWLWRELRSEVRSGSSHRFKTRKRAIEHAVQVFTPYNPNPQKDREMLETIGRRVFGQDVRLS